MSGWNISQQTCLLSYATGSVDMHKNSTGLGMLNKFQIAIASIVELKNSLPQCHSTIGCFQVHFGVCMVPGKAYKLISMPVQAIRTLSRQQVIPVLQLSTGLFQACWLRFTNCSSVTLLQLGYRLQHDIHLAVIHVYCSINCLPKGRATTHVQQLCNAAKSTLNVNLQPRPISVACATVRQELLISRNALQL